MHTGWDSMRLPDQYTPVQPPHLLTAASPVTPAAPFFLLALQPALPLSPCSRCRLHCRSLPARAATCIAVPPPRAPHSQVAVNDRWLLRVQA
eukprot:278670-Chlamydomonas_euryale.AAC.1